MRSILQNIGQDLFAVGVTISMASKWRVPSAWPTKRLFHACCLDCTVGWLAGMLPAA